MVVLLNGEPYPGPAAPGSHIRLEYQFAPGELGRDQVEAETFDIVIVLQKLGALCVEARTTKGGRLAKLYGAVAIGRKVKP
jgi:hypothetical protein